MCGIAGILSLGKERIDQNELLKMSSAIKHRGPDDEGYVLIDSKSKSWKVFSGQDSIGEIKSKHDQLSGFENNRHDIGLAHRRFSIIDLSSGGHQPLFNVEEEICVVFNGEIYNYVELKDELIKLGYSFRTNSDTEVLVQAYHCWGNNFVQHLNGFWAILLYDFRNNKLICSRDRVGKKSLYWCAHNGNLYFSSEIKGLLAIDSIFNKASLNIDRAVSWIEHGLETYDNSTFFNDIFNLPPACIGQVDKIFPETLNQFWDIPSSRKIERNTSVEEVTREFRDIFTDAVKIRMRADVPLGIELSGGMDSSIICATASKLSNSKLTAVTVGIKSNPKYDETHFAEQVVSHLGNIDHRIIGFPELHYWRSIKAYTYLHEEPYHSPNMFSNQVIWSRLREMGIKVSLNGAAGDELFAGYNKYYPFYVRDNIAKLNLTEMSRNLVGNPTKGYFQIIKSYGAGTLNIGKSIFSKNYIRGSELENRLNKDFKLSTIPYWMRSGDKNTMGVPFETRAPFLDYRLIEFAFSLPSNYLIRGGWPKWIIRKAMEDQLPQEVIWRKAKMGFPFNYEDFFDDKSGAIKIILNSFDNKLISKDYFQLLIDRKQFVKAVRVLSFILWNEFFINKNVELFNNLEKIENDGNQDHTYNSSYFAQKTLLD